MKLMKLAITALLFVAAMNSTVHSELLVLEPTRIAVLPATERGATQVALYFDLSSLPNGEKRVVDMAHLEWTPTNKAVEESCIYTAAEISASWTALGATNEGLVSVSSEKAAKWRVEPTDFERTAGIVKLELTSNVTAWADGARTNHGIVITSAALSRSDAQARLGNARLVIRYGYR